MKSFGIWYTEFNDFIRRHQSGEKKHHFRNITTPPNGSVICFQINAPLDYMSLMIVRVVETEQTGSGTWIYYTGDFVYPDPNTGTGEPIARADGTLSCDLNTAH